jgi:hypothetical protein
MDIRKHEPDHLPGEPAPGAGIFSPRLWAVSVLVWFLLMLRASVAFAERAAEWHERPRHDAEGRIYVYGSNGDYVGARAVRFMAMIERGEPIHVTGRHFSASAMVLEVVRRVPGSCLGEDVLIGIHALYLGNVITGPLLTRPAPWLTHEAYAATLGPQLGAWYLAAVRSGELTPLRDRTFTARELMGLGYPICRDGGRRIAYPLTS